MAVYVYAKVKSSRRIEHLTLDERALEKNYTSQCGVNWREREKDSAAEVSYTVIMKYMQSNQGGVPNGT